MKQSIKATQSELGVTGDVSDNAEQLLTIREELMDRFKVAEGELSDLDSVIFIGNVNVGRDINGTQPLCLCTFTMGNYESMIESVAQTIAKDPSFINILGEGMMRGQHYILQEAMNKNKRR